MRHTAILLALGLTAACASSPRVPDAPPAASLSGVSLAETPDRFFTSSDARIRYREVGQGTPVVLIHGLTRTLDEWVPLADSLSRQARVIALDLRGHGQSSRFTDPARLGPHMVHDVARLLDHLGIQSAYIGGHSLGAEVAANMAVRHSARTRGVILIAGGFSPDSAAEAQGLETFVADLQGGRGLQGLLRWIFPALPDSTIQRYNDETLRSNPPEQITAALRSSMALLVREGQVAQRIPSLIIVGSADPLVPGSKWLASWWPNARLLELPGADHLSVLYHPETLAAIRSFIRAPT